MSELKLGQIIGGIQYRDAIHIAVAPVVAGEQLTPGKHVILTNEGLAIAAGEDDPIGIVDPFLKLDVAQGQTFWLVLMPNTTTGMRHQWEHPRFTDEGAKVLDKVTSEKWLRDFCKNNDCPSYDTVLAMAIDKELSYDDTYYEGPVSYNGDYLVFNGIDAHCDVPPELWLHIEIVTGQKIPDWKKKITYFSCTC